MSHANNVERRRQLRIERLATGLCPCGKPLSKRTNPQTGNRLTTCDPCADVRLERDRVKRDNLRKAKSDAAIRLRRETELRAANKPIPLTPAQVEAKIRQQTWLEVKDEWENCRTNGEFTKWVAARAKGAVTKAREVTEES